MITTGEFKTKVLRKSEKLIGIGDIEYEFYLAGVRYDTGEPNLHRNVLRRSNKMANPKAVVLLSGGLDSTTVLAIASKRDGYDCYALSFDYKQRHQVELEYAANQARIWGVKEHRVIQIGMEYMTYHNADASLVNKGVDVPEMRDIDEMSDGIPSTYVPARNTIFLGYAASYAEVIGAEKIYIGVNVLDYSGYPDCRPEYILAYQDML